MRRTGLIDPANNSGTLRLHGNTGRKDETKHYVPIYVSRWARLKPVHLFLYKDQHIYDKRGRHTSFVSKQFGLVQ